MNEHDPVDGLEPRLEKCLLRDEPDLRRLAVRISSRQLRGLAVDRDVARLEQRLQLSCSVVSARSRSVAGVHLSPDLPVTAHARDIADAARSSQVVVIAGDTGSGKTTQLPKLLLRLGFGARGMIGVTQPRRLAATSVAARVADELGDPGWERVGYQVRFDQRLSAGTLIKFMTDGILLAETQADPSLLAYDALVVDEAHERNLNVDFLLGYLRQVLPHRPELKVWISSATLDVDRVAGFFDAAPIIRVSGRTYPVEVRYRPPADGDGDLALHTANAVVEVLGADAAGDLLVFLPGERDILDCARYLEGRVDEGLHVLPLYSRLPAEEQRKVFHPAPGRRVILATNVAETSITVPGIRWVIDTGLARVRRYHHRTQVEKLHIEPISRASADQRKGRCGRIGPGICLRLYEESDLKRRPAFTDPEIKRSSLAGVILSMLDLGLGDIAAFPLLDPPKRAMIQEGYRELFELGAIDGRHRLTNRGRRLARFPVEPRLSRVLIEAHQNGIMDDALTVVAGLSVDDPRQRPVGREEAADQARAGFEQAPSDARVLLNLWHALPESGRDQRSARALRTFCRRHFLSVRRVHEWRAVREQLADTAKRVGLRRTDARADDDLLHRTLLAGFVSRIGCLREAETYQGARDVRFAIHPRSCRAGTTPTWIVATEFVETNRMYATTVAPIKPSWVEPLAAHLVERSYEIPFWDASSGFVRALETVRLYGLPIVQGRRRDYGAIDPVRSRQVFIQHALVYGEMRSLPDCIRHNLDLVSRIAEQEAKVRQLDLLISEREQIALYDRAVPSGIHCTRDFLRWLRSAEAEAARALRWSERDVVLRPAGELTSQAFPDRLDFPQGSLPLRYTFHPGREDDGITCTISPNALPVLSSPRFEWLVPGRLREKLEYMMKGLPKRYRRELVPIPRAVEEALEDLAPSDRPLREALSEWARQRRGAVIPPDAWPTDLPGHLRMRFELVGETGEIADAGRDVKGFTPPTGAAPGHPSAGSAWQRSGVTEWDFGEMPDRILLGDASWSVPWYPGIVDEGRSVAQRLFAHQSEARQATAYGLARLGLLACPAERRAVMEAAALSSAALLDQVTLGLGRADFPAQIAVRAVAESCRFFDDDVPRTAAAFRERLGGTKCRFPAQARRRRTDVEAYLSQGAALVTELRSSHSEAANDMRKQLSGLLHGRFVLDTPAAYWSELPRYLQGIEIRRERRRLSTIRDDRKAAELIPCLVRQPPEHGDPAAWETYRWMLEEWRISLFAQELGTLFPVSRKRLEAQWLTIETEAAGEPAVSRGR